MTSQRDSYGYVLHNCCLTVRSSQNIKQSSPICGIQFSGTDKFKSKCIPHISDLKEHDLHMFTDLTQDELAYVEIT